MEMKRLLGLPGWFAPAAVESLSTLWIPRFSLTVAEGIVDKLGPAERIDAALSLSGRALCLLQYEGKKQTRLMAWALRDFIALWNEVPNAIRASEAWSPSPLWLWLENTNACEQIIDAKRNAHLLSQRNGVLMHSEIPSKTANETIS